MRIKYSEGQTILTLIRVLVVILACLCVGGAYRLVGGAFSTAATARESVAEILESGGRQTVSGTPTVLYYSESGEEGGQVSSYQMYYLTGDAGAYGLCDAGGARILDEVYQGIILLPHAYLLQQQDLWRFYDKDTLTLLNDASWEEVEVLRSDNGRFASSLVSVKRDGLFGAVDMRGEVVIEPAYEYFQLSSLEADWPLIRVRQNGKYGYIDSTGQVVVSLSYDYAVLDTVLLYQDENDAEGTETPIIYVLREGDWGALYRNADGSSSEVDWSVEPSAEVLAAYGRDI